MEHNKINHQHNELYRLVNDAGISIFDAFILDYEVFPVVKLNKQDAESVNRYDAIHYYATLTMILDFLLMRFTL